MTTITARSLQSARPKQAPYFIRDDKVKGFAVKVNPSGSIKLIAEVRHNGRTVRKTIGQYPHTDLTIMFSYNSAETQTIIAKNLFINRSPAEGGPAGLFMVNGTDFFNHFVHTLVLFTFCERSIIVNILLIRI